MGRVERKLHRQKRAVLEKRRELERIERKIDHRLSRLEDARAVPLDEICVVGLPACRVAWMEGTLKVGEPADMEGPIRRLDQPGAEAVVFLGKVGLGISREHLAAGQTGSYDGIFLALDEEDAYAGETMVPPASQCVRVRFRGSRAQAPTHYARLPAHIGERGMRIVGFSREVTLIDYGITDDIDAFVTEICIPVERA